MARRSAQARLDLKAPQTGFFCAHP